MTLPAAKATLEGLTLKLALTAGQAEALGKMLKRGYLKAQLTEPGRVRTSPQSRCINGWLQVISEETGQDFGSLKEYFKFQALSRGYPFDEIGGVILPWSETRCNTIQAAALINTIEQEAAELSITLPRYDE